MKVALAGGTGGLGQYIVDAFVNAGRQDELVIFSRSGKTDKDPRTGIPIKGVDYGNIPSLTKTLDELAIDTIVSVLVSFDLGELESQQANLIDAGVASKSVKRYIPSEWAMDCGIIKPYTPIWNGALRKVREKLETTDLEYTSVCPGLLTDYLLPGEPKYHAPWPIPVKPNEAKALIPGTGDELLTLTSSEDIASALLLLLDAPRGSWPKVTYTAGDNTSWNRVLALAEEATGKKFSVERISAEELERRITKSKQDNDMLQFVVQELELYGSVQSGMHLPDRSDIVKGIKYTTVEDVLKLFKK